MTKDELEKLLKLDPYLLLKIKDDATDAQIQAAFNERMKELGNKLDIETIDTQLAQKLRLTYEKARLTLLDPVKRQQLNQQLASQVSVKVGENEGRYFQVQAGYTLEQVEQLFQQWLADNKLSQLQGYGATYRNDAQGRKVLVLQFSDPVKANQFMQSLMNQNIVKPMYENPEHEKQPGAAKSPFELPNPRKTPVLERA